MLLSTKVCLLISYVVYICSCFKWSFFNLWLLFYYISCNFYLLLLLEWLSALLCVYCTYSIFSAFIVFLYTLYPVPFWLWSVRIIKFSCSLACSCQVCPSVHWDDSPFWFPKSFFTFFQVSHGGLCWSPSLAKFKLHIILLNKLVIICLLILLF